MATASRKVADWSSAILSPALNEPGGRRRVRTAVRSRRREHAGGGSESGPAWSAAWTAAAGAVGVATRNDSDRYFAVWRA